MGPRLRLLTCECKTALLDPEFQVSIGPRSLLCCFFAFKAATLASELLVSVGSSPHLLFLHQKQQFYDQIYKSLCPRPQLCFCIQNSDFSSRIVSLYESQPSSVVLCIHNRDIMTRINSLYGSLTSPVLLCMQNNVFSIRITSLKGSQPSFVVFASKTTALGPEIHVSLGPRLHLWFFHPKQWL